MAGSDSRSQLSTEADGGSSRDRGDTRVDASPNSAFSTFNGSVDGFNQRVPVPYSNRKSADSRKFRFMTDTHRDLQMTPDEMLDLANRAAQLLVDRIENESQGDAWDGEFREGLESMLLEDPPETGQPASEVLDRAAREVMPYAARLGHPRFFGFIPSSPTWPGIVADFVAAGFNINAITWFTASGPSQVELVVIEWFRRWLGYPESAGGILTSGGSVSGLDAFIAARESAGNPDRPTAYMSDQSHIALNRAAMTVGVRPECTRMIPSDENFRIDMDALKRAVADDRAAGFNPIVVCATAGTTSTGSIDPLEEMADFCQSENIWLHVDGAYGGFAVATEEGKKRLRGIERADSVQLDAHKWFFQPYEVGCLMVKDAETLEAPFRVRPDVLQDTVWGANHPNFVDRGLQFSRGFRALKVWMSVQTFGMAAFRRAISKSMELADRADEYVNDSQILEIMSPTSLGVVCFRVNPEDNDLDEESLEQINRTVLARLFWEDPSLVSSTALKGTFSLRICILNSTTTWEDVRDTIQAAERFGKDAITAETSD